MHYHYVTKMKRFQNTADVKPWLVQRADQWHLEADLGTWTTVHRSSSSSAVNQL